MAIDKVICPECGAENMASPLITMCSSCLGSLEGAKPAPEPEPPSVVAAEPAPVVEPEVPEPPSLPEPAAPPPPPEHERYLPSRSPEVDIQTRPASPPEPSPPPPEPPAQEPPAPPERESYQPARLPETGATVSGPLYAELPSPTVPADVQPPQSYVPPLEVPTIPSGPSVSEPIREAEGPAFQALKIICPNCRAANPPHHSRCNLCNTQLPTAADAWGGSDWARQWGTQPDRLRGSTAGQTRWGAACGCLILGFIFALLLVVSRFA